MYIANNLIEWKIFYGIPFYYCVTVNLINVVNLRNLVSLLKLGFFANRFTMSLTVVDLLEFH